MQPSCETLCRCNSAHPNPVKIPLAGYVAHRFVSSHTIVLVSHVCGPTYDHDPENPPAQRVGTV
jgi:hypothetical protein